MRHIIICLLIPSFTIAQQKPLSIGDTIPRQQLQYLKTFPYSPLGAAGIKTKTFPLSPLGAGGIIILDFFATFCTACIKELPKLDSLQQQFGGKLQVIIITGESTQKLEALRKKNKVFANCKLPIVYGDTVFRKFFRHKGVPHEVWLDQNGKVLAITDQYAITPNNIQAFLNGDHPKLAVKSDAFDFDHKKPLLLDDNGGIERNLLFQTKFMNYLPGLSSPTGLVHRSGTRWYIVNFPIIYLYREALDFTLNRAIIETNDPSRYLVPQKTPAEWKESNLFSWEFISQELLPKASIQPILLQDLNRYLGLHGRMEKRRMKCMAITRLNNNDTTLKTKGAKSTIKSNDTEDILFINKPFSKFIEGLNASKYSKPGTPIFLDETGISFNVDITWPSEIKLDITLLKKFLSGHGLQLIEVEREIDMFILSENKTPKQ